MSGAKVELIDVALKGSVAGLFIPNTTSETTLVATRCEFANSSHCGALVQGLSAFAIVFLVMLFGFNPYLSNSLSKTCCASSCLSSYKSWLIN